MVRRWIAASAGALLATAVLAACSGSGSSALKLSVTPARALYDTPISVRVSGLSAGETVDVGTSSVDSHGTTWTSSARFRASSAGVASTAAAPVSGSYSGVNPMGLFEDQAPNGSTSTAALFAPPGTWRINVSAEAGGHRVATTVTRLLAQQAGVTVRELRPPGDHLYADLFSPPPTATGGSRRPAVLVFGGSEGGMGGAVQASLLAAHGYPAMSLAYFAEPGLPKTAERIPLEYFESALHMLAAQPGVDRRHVLVWGWSIGSEAAELLGAQDPGLVGGVIATVPGADITHGYPSSQPLWTRNGRAVRTGLPDDPLNPLASPQSPAAIIPVEKIRGPVMFVCAGHDEVWPSCTFTDEMVARRAAHHASAPVVLKYPDAGHLVATLRADLPDTDSSISFARSKPPAACPRPTPPPEPTAGPTS